MANAYDTAKKALGDTKNTATLTQPKLNTSIQPTAIKYGSNMTAQDRELQSAASLSELYGNIDYDRAAIESIFQGATDAEFAAKRAAYNRTANQFYNNLGTAQGSILEAQRRANAQAVQSGANAGMQNANQLSLLLGMSQQSTADATQLAQDARALEDEYAAARAQNVQDALEYANTQKMALGQLGSNIYATDAQKYVGELGYNAQIAAANAAASAEARAADQALRGTLYNADANLSGQRYASDSSFNASRLNALADLYGNMYNADQNLAGTKYTADSYRRNTASGSSGYSSSRSSSGGSSSSSPNIVRQVAGSLMDAGLFSSTGNPDIVRAQESKLRVMYGDKVVDEARAMALQELRASQQRKKK
jgi:hypothetical protein